MYGLRQTTADILNLSLHDALPIYSAKGLEWDAVFLVGLTDTTLPIQHAVTDAQLAEERRLLYVGITRARERLALSWRSEEHTSELQSRGHLVFRLLHEIKNIQMMI